MQRSVLSRLNAPDAISLTSSFVGLQKKKCGHKRISRNISVTAVHFKSNYCRTVESHLFRRLMRWPLDRYGLTSDVSDRINRKILLFYFTRKKIKQCIFRAVDIIIMHSQINNSSATVSCYESSDTRAIAGNDRDKKHVPFFTIYILNGRDFRLSYACNGNTERSALCWAQ